MTSSEGELAQLVERSLCMRKVVDSISAFSIGGTEGVTLLLF